MLPEPLNETVSHLSAARLGFFLGVGFGAVVLWLGLGPAMRLLAWGALGAALSSGASVLFASRGRLSRAWAVLRDQGPT